MRLSPAMPPTISWFQEVGFVMVRPMRQRSESMTSRPRTARRRRQLVDAHPAAPLLGHASSESRGLEAAGARAIAERIIVAMPAALYQPESCPRPGHEGARLERLLLPTSTRSYS